MSGPIRSSRDSKQELTSCVLLPQLRLFELVIVVSFLSPRDKLVKLASLNYSWFHRIHTHHMWRTLKLTRCEFARCYHRFLARMGNLDVITLECCGAVLSPARVAVLSTAQ